MQVCGFRQEFMEKWPLFREVFFFNMVITPTFFLFTLYSLPSTFVFVWWSLLSCVRYMVRAKHGTGIIGTKYGVKKNHFLALLPQFLRCAWRSFYQMGQSQYVFSFPRYGHLCAGFFFLCSKKYVASPTVEFCSDNKRISGKQTKILIKIIKKQYKVLTTGAATWLSLSKPDRPEFAESRSRWSEKLNPI